MPDQKELTQERLTVVDTNELMNALVAEFEQAVELGSLAAARKSLEDLLQLTFFINKATVEQPHMEWELTHKFMDLFARGFAIGRAFNDLNHQTEDTGHQETPTQQAAQRLSNDATAPLTAWDEEVDEVATADAR